MLWSRALGAAAVVALFSSLAMAQSTGPFLNAANETSTSDESFADPSTEREVIEERYPSGKIKIRREVRQDNNENYLNDGSFSMWDERGAELAVGQFVNGQRHGAWFRVYSSIQQLDFPLPPNAAQFTAPFISHATFDHGKLSGEWMISDARDRMVVCWSFKDGRRDGVSSWWHPNKNKWREFSYRDGQLDGEFREWAADKRLLRDDRYINGRLAKLKTDWYTKGVKRFEGSFLGPVVLDGANVDWWLASCHDLPAANSDQAELREGHWIVWHRNQQKAIEGDYQDDHPVGVYQWWYNNGQLACKGEYVDGHPNGTWTWWHANGQKQLQGSFAFDGTQAGKWTWWDESGRAIKSRTISEGDGGALMGKSPHDGVPTIAERPVADVDPLPARPVATPQDEPVRKAPKPVRAAEKQEFRVRAVTR